MLDETIRGTEILVIVGAIASILVLILAPVMWTVHRILRPVDLAARERNLPFRFSMGDFLCLFWIVQLPLGFLDRIADGEPDQYYWVLLGAVWAVAPLAWVTVARALSKAGVSMGKHRMIFLGLVLPTVYYGLFPFIGMSIAVVIGIVNRGLQFFLERQELASWWFVLALSLVACGFYSPWMVRHVAEEFDDVELIPRLDTESSGRNHPRATSEL
jgi:hypothetical protein